MRRVLFAMCFACGELDASTPPTSTTTTTFAVNQFFWGDTTRSFVVTNDAWRSFGVNLDGKVTDATSTDVCTLASGGSQVDGVNGMDNNLGATLVKTFQPELGSTSAEATNAIDAGGWTIQFQITGLSDDPDQTSTNLSARAFSSGAFDGTTPPAFDDTTDWPVASTSLRDGATLAGGALDDFPSATIVHGVFNAGGGATLHLVLHHQGASIPLVLHAPSITFTHVGDDALDGTIAGVLDIQEFTAAMRAVASHISLSLCGAAFDGVAKQYAAAADILRDGSNRAGVPCDGISVGFGFTARRVTNPTKVAQVAPLVDVCP